MSSSRSRRLASLAIAASLVALTACAGNPPAQPTPGAPVGATGAGGTTPAVAGPGQGVIRGQVSAEGIAAGAFRTLLQAAGGKGKVKATSAVDTREVECAEDGSFACVVKGGGEYTLEASIPDGKGGVFKVVSDKKISVPLANDPPIVDAPSLVTRRTGSIQGVVSLKDGKPGDTAEGADVFLSGGTSVVGKCGETGRFALTNVAEGTWNLVVMKPGYKRVLVKDVAVKAGKPRLLDTPVVLERETSDAVAGIKGVVQSSTGGAVAGATISAFPKDRSKLVGNDAALDNFTAISDDQGAFEMLNLPPGDYEVQVYRPFYQLPPRMTASVKAGAPADMGTIKLASTVAYFGKVAGQVVDGDGAPIDGAVIQLDPPVTDAQFADARGNFTLDRILPGEYNLSVAAGGYTTVVMPVVVENVQNFQLTLPKGIALLGDKPLFPTPAGGGKPAKPEPIVVTPDKPDLLTPKVTEKRVPPVEAPKVPGPLAYVADLQATDGGAAASWVNPHAVACDAAGNVYIGVARAIRKVAPDGTTTTLGSGSLVSDPSDFQFAPDGFLYVLEYYSNRILKVSTDGKTATIVLGPNGEFAQPHQIAVAKDGTMYVASYGNCRIYKVMPDGRVSVLAGTGGWGADDGPAAGATFGRPTGVAISADQKWLYVSDRDNGRMRRIDLAANTVDTLTASGWQANPSGPRGFGGIQHLAFDGAGQLLGAGIWDHVLWRINPTDGLVNAVVANGQGDDNGPTAGARLNSPHGLDVDPAGNVYLTELYANKVRVISPAGGRADR